MKKLVISTGAGMSAESGIATFRDAGGLWEKYPVMDVASADGFARNPSLIHRFYNERRHDLVKAQPNAGHRAIVELEKHFRVYVITQNVDDLHERAGSSHVIHLHGELLKVCSSADPDDTRYHRTLTAANVNVAHGQRAADGSLLRPWIVWFGEAVPRLADAAEAAAEADIFVIVGSSLNVYPAAGLVRYVPAAAPVYLIDPKEVRVPSGRHVEVIQQVATTGMRELCRRLGVQCVQ